MNSEQVQQLLAGLGAMSEMCKAFYDDAVLQKFTPEQSLYLTGILLQTILTPKFPPTSQQ